MDSKAGNNYVKHVVKERHCHHISRLYLAYLAHTFDFEVSQSCPRAIARLVDRAPKIKPIGLPANKVLRGYTQHSPTAATHIENSFVASKLQIVQKL
jgi:hypothetical protein